MYLMQIWFNLSDEGIEDSIYDSYAMRTFMHIPYLYDTEVNEDGSVLSGKIGIEYVDAPNIFPVTWKNGEVSECIFAFG